VRSAIHQISPHRRGEALAGLARRPHHRGARSLRQCCTVSALACTGRNRTPRPAGTRSVASGRSGGTRSVASGLAPTMGGNRSHDGAWPSMPECPPPSAPGGTWPVTSGPSYRHDAPAKTELVSRRPLSPRPSSYSTIAHVRPPGTMVPTYGYHSPLAAHHLRRMPASLFNHARRWAQPHRELPLMPNNRASQAARSPRPSQ